MPATSEVSKAQVRYSLSAGYLSNPIPKSYATYRQIRKHPTVALGRAMSMAPVVAGDWSVEAHPDASSEMVEFIAEWLLPLRSTIMGPAYAGTTDFGWQPFEVVYGLRDNRMVPVKIKALLQDLTEILVAAETGAFDGFYQQRDQVTVEVEQSLNIPLRVEGTNWYGESLLENVRDDYSSWLECQKAASRYDRKIAGTSVVVYYPVGRTDYDGDEKDNAEIAGEVQQALESSGSVTLPRIPHEELQGENSGWQIDYEGDSSPKQYSFTNRLEYLDKLMLRGLILPERAVSEGKYGTKAEAEVHADVALAQRQLDHEEITRLVNWHLTDRLLAWNFGEQWRGKVWLAAAPLADATVALAGPGLNAVAARTAQAGGC
jgi:hypothetical protein